MYRLKTRREAAGLSQSQLAERSGVPARMIRAYEAENEAGHRDINKAEALKVFMLARALGCGVGDILEIDDGDNM